MNKFFLIVALLLLFTVTASQAQEESSINFSSTSWEQVQQQASREKKPVFLYAYTPACRYCARMEREVFTSKSVADFYNTGFVSYKINIDDGAEGTALASKYDIVGFPTYLYFSPSGELMHQSGTAKAPEDFILDGKNALDPQKALFALKNRFDKGDRSPALLFHYSEALASYHSADNPQEVVVAAYMDTQSAEQLASEKNLRFLFASELGFHAPATQYFLSHQAHFIPLFSAKEVSAKAEWIIRKTARTAGKEANDILYAALQQTIAAHFADTGRLSAIAAIYFHQGQRAWPTYAAATLAYNKDYPESDQDIVLETATYLKHFAKEQQALETGVLLMEQLIGKKKSYEHLYLYAQLLHKSGRPERAAAAASEAVQLAVTTGEDSSQAALLIKALEKVE